MPVTSHANVWTVGVWPILPPARQTAFEQPLQRRTTALTEAVRFPGGTEGPHRRFRAGEAFRTAQGHRLMAMRTRTALHEDGAIDLATIEGHGRRPECL